MMKLSRWLVLSIFLINCSPVFAAPLSNESKGDVNYTSIAGITKGFQQNGGDTIIIRFDYKQSALYHGFTFKALDSIVSILLNNPAVTLSIDGYAYKDEGSDTICYFLSLNRALFIHTYILGRGVDSSKIISVKGLGKVDPLIKKIDKDGLIVNVRAELVMNYPVPPKKPGIQDRDRDGITDNIDKCPDEYGDKVNDGCPNDAVIVPFEVQQSALHSMTYKVLDSVIAVLGADPSITVSIEGHAHQSEGINAVCYRLSYERADIVKNYLLSRRIPGSRIDSVKGSGSLHPLNAGNNPREILRNSRAEIFLIRH